MLGWQDYVTEPSKKMTQEEIIEKVEQLENDRYYIHRCISVEICPNCGRNLSKDTDASFSCKCGFKYI